MANPYFTWPITITALGAPPDDDWIMTVGGNKDTTVLAATTTARWSDTDFSAAVKTTMELHGDSATWTVSLDESGYLTLTHSINGEVTIHWDEMNATTVQLMGFDDAAADVAGTAGTPASFTSDYTVDNAWFPNVCDSDNHERRSWQWSNFEGIAVPGATQVYGSWFVRMWAFDFVDAIRATQHFADQASFATPLGAVAGDPNIAWENMFEQMLANVAMYFHEDATEVGDGPYYVTGTAGDVDTYARIVAAGGGAWHEVQFSLKRTGS